jgi:hypothetical protein
MDTDINGFIQALDNIAESLTYSVTLPSTREQLTFKQLNTYQFNKIITSFSATTSTDTGKAVVEILQENAQTKTPLIKDISVFDYVYILLETKKQCLADEMFIFLTEDEIETYNLNSPHSISITDFLITKKDIVPVPPLTVQIDGITITCSLPTVYRELEAQIVDIDTNTETHIENIFLTTIVKYIDDITIQSNIVKFNEQNLYTKLEIVRRLPAHVINSVIKAIEKIKIPLTRLTTIELKNNEGELVLNKEIPLAGDLFNF